MHQSQEPLRRCTRYGAVTPQGNQATFPPLRRPRDQMFYFKRYLGSLHGRPTPRPESTAKACSCGAGKAGGTTWCAACGVGYVNGKKTACKGCVAKAQGGEACADCKGK